MDKVSSSNSLGIVDNESRQKYLVYGQRLSSNLPLSHLVPATFSKEDIDFQYIPGNGGTGLLPDSAELLTRLRTNLGSYLSVYDNRESILLRWEGRYDFQVAGDGRQIRCRPGPDFDIIQMRAALYGVVLSFALLLKGVGNLHASAVVLPGGAVGFMADPGGGKSTLAAAFAQEGYPFLTDDVLALAEGPCGYLAYPGFPSVSLSGNSLHALFGPKKGLAQIPSDGEKKRLAIGGNWAQFQHDPVPVQGLFILNRASEGAAIAIERLPRAEEAMHGLLANTSCLPILPVTVLRQQLAFVARLTKSVPVWRLTYPSGFQHTSNIIERLLILTASGSEIPIRVAP